MQLIWFRQDLRIADQSALWHAAQAGLCAAIVFISPEQSMLHDDAPVKCQFYLRQLDCLKHQLQTLNIPLIILHAPLWKDIPQQLKELCIHLRVQCLHANCETGVNEQLVRNVREALDKEGFQHVKIVVSGGFNPERIRLFEQNKVPVDVYAVGSSIFATNVDFTSDVVLLDGKPCAKVGRNYTPNDRLEDVEM